MRNSAEHPSVIAEGLSLYAGGWGTQTLLYIAAFGTSLTLTLIADIGLGLDESRVVQLAVLLVFSLLVVLPLLYVIIRRFASHTNAQKVGSREAARQPATEWVQQRRRPHNLAPRQTLIEAGQWVATARESEMAYLGSIRLQLEEYVVQEQDFIITSDLEQ